MLLAFANRNASFWRPRRMGQSLIVIRGIKVVTRPYSVCPIWTHRFALTN